MTMDRLTSKNRPPKGAVPGRFGIDFIFQMDDDEVAGFFETMNRLADYEDTGLTPEQVVTMKGLHTARQDLIAENEKLKADMRAFAEDVAHQFGYHSQHNGRLTLTHGGLSTLEWAFDILGWENPHPDPENECQHEGCHHYASCGTPTKDGYKRLCSYHFNELRAKDTNVPGKKEARP